MDVGQSGGPIVAGALIGAYSYRSAFAIVGAGMFVISIIFGILMRSMKFEKAGDEGCGTPEQ
jgi:dipeptide/tripeptide permease